MPIKVGFSTSVCPGWEWSHIAEQADTLGFYGVELGAVNGAFHLPASPEFQDAHRIDAVRDLFGQRNVEIVSLLTRHAVDSRIPRQQQQSADAVAEVIDLAGKLGCAYVRMPLGAPQGRESLDAAIPRQLSQLRRLADHAAQCDVTLLVSNTAGFPGSRALWTAVDGVTHPRLRCSWNPVIGLGMGERSTISIPRLGARIRMVQAADAEFDDTGRFLGFCPIDEGAVDWANTVDLLKGVVFDGYLMLDWPAAAAQRLADPHKTLPAALSHLLERIKHQEPPLSAYQKDKNAPNWSAAPQAYVERPSAGSAPGADVDVDATAASGS